MRFKSAKIETVFKYLFWTWLLLILTFSSIPELPGPDFETRDSILRLDYIIHFIEYFVLISLLLFWRGGKNYHISTRFVLITLIGSIVVATLDEYHQIWIPGRTFNPMDMYANFAGILTGMFSSLLVLARLRAKQPDNK